MFNPGRMETNRSPSGPSSSSSSSEDERARRVLLAECAVVNVASSATARSSSQRDHKRSSNRPPMDQNAEETDVELKLKQKAAKMLDAYLDSRIDFGQHEDVGSAPQPSVSKIDEKNIKGGL